jgi:cytochrome c5
MRPTRALIVMLGSVAACLAGQSAEASSGHELIKRFECNRCHAVPGVVDAPQEKHCVRCHQNILSGKFEAPSETLTQWRQNITSLREVPSLENMKGRFEWRWVRDFLLEPRDLRPRLDATMPRLALSPAEAEALAKHLAGATKPSALAPGGDPERGRRHLGERGCTVCHLYSGAPPSASKMPFALEPEALLRGMMLAPDLRHTRDRMVPAAVVAQIKTPAPWKTAASPMPTLPVSDAEALDIAAWILGAPLEASKPRRAPAPLPLLKRRVSFDEVNKKVFKKVCWHCHAEADYASGDGGPGNTGGFGFSGRGINFANFAAVASGGRDAEGERRSLFRPLEGSQTPWLVAALRARQSEEAGSAVAGLRGMPLGLPALSPTEIQLVESWIAQGQPR